MGNTKSCCGITKAKKAHILLDGIEIDAEQELHDRRTAFQEAYPETGIGVVPDKDEYSPILSGKIKRPDKEKGKDPDGFKILENKHVSNSKSNSRENSPTKTVPNRESRSSSEGPHKNSPRLSKLSKNSKNSQSSNYLYSKATETLKRELSFKRKEKIKEISLTNLQDSDLDPVNLSILQREGKIRSTSQSMTDQLNQVDMYEKLMAITSRIAHMNEKNKKENKENKENTNLNNSDSQKSKYDNFPERKSQKEISLQDFLKENDPVKLVKTNCSYSTAQFDSIMATNKRLPDDNFNNNQRLKFISGPKAGSSLPTISSLDNNSTLNRNRKNTNVVQQNQNDDNFDTDNNKELIATKQLEEIAENLKELESPRDIHQHCSYVQERRKNSPKMGVRSAIRSKSCQPRPTSNNNSTSEDKDSSLAATLLPLETSVLSTVDISSTDPEILASIDKAISQNRRSLKKIRSQIKEYNKNTATMQKLMVRSTTGAYNLPGELKVDRKQLANVGHFRLLDVEIEQWSGQSTLTSSRSVCRIFFQA